MTDTSGKHEQAGQQPQAPMDQRQVPAMVQLPGREALVMPLPNQHVRTIVEFLRPGTPDLSRRWISALLLVPEAEREAVVASVERRIVETYASGQGARGGAAGTSAAAAATPEATERQVTVVYPPVAKDGYTEQVHRTFGVVDGASRPQGNERQRGATGPEVKAGERKPKKGRRGA
jgi:hypothetical protein